MSDPLAPDDANAALLRNVAPSDWVNPVPAPETSTATRNGSPMAPR